MSWQLSSFALLALALAGGFAWYERSRPSSRTVAVVAALAALAALGRVAFVALPDIKPTTDIVVVAGYTLGGPPGFAVGAVAALASNFVFGQGPWTPWQMLGWGATGLLGAALGRRLGPLPRVAMALACAAAGFGYGLILNFSTWVTFTGQHTLAQFLVIEGEAFPFDLAHAIGNFVFFLAFGPALIRALSRFRARMEIQWGIAASAALVLAAATAGLSGGGGAETARAASPPARGEGAVAAYLVHAQNRDGGFGLAPGAPSSQLAGAWAVIALAATGDEQASARRGAAWIGSHLGQLDGAGDLERTILALAAAHAPLHGLPAQLRRDQRADGSVSGQANLTAFALLAWCAAGSNAGTAAAVAWLARQQNGDGGFGFGRRGDPADIDDTAAAVEALVAQDGPKGSLARARAYLERQENTDGGFPLQPGGASNSQSTAWAVQALAALRAPTARGLTYLRARTSASGAVDYAAGERQTPVWVTAEALAALALRPLPIV